MACYCLSFLSVDWCCLLLLTICRQVSVAIVTVSFFRLVLHSITYRFILLISCNYLPAPSITYLFFLLLGVAYRFFLRLVLLGNAIANRFFLLTGVDCYCLAFLFVARCRLLLLIVSFCRLVLIAIAYHFSCRPVSLAIAYCFFPSTGVACYCFTVSVCWLVLTGVAWYCLLFLSEA